MKFTLPAARFEPHRRRLTRLARGWLGDRAEAEDAVQDTYLRVHDDLPSTPDGEAAWLVTVLRHVCIDRMRRRRLLWREAAEAAHAEHEPSAEHHAALAMDAQAALRRMARCLRPDDMAAMLLHVVFDFEHGEIARLAGQSEAAIRQRMHRALRRLRQEEHAGDPRPRDPAPDHEALFSLCWRAVQLRNAAALVARFVAVPRPQPATGSALATRWGGGAGSPRVAAALMQVDGTFALAWSMDGVVLCTLPVGPLVASEAAAAQA
jgi:RNA polymerase sigma-70 factor (ECF subfamily)